MIELNFNIMVQPVTKIGLQVRALRKNYAKNETGNLFLKMLKNPQYRISQNQ